jgi:hypothetical protein
MGAEIHAEVRRDGLLAVAEFEAEFGPLPHEADERARAALAAAGLLDFDLEEPDGA